VRLTLNNLGGELLFHASSANQQHRVRGTRTEIGWLSVHSTAAESADSLGGLSWQRLFASKRGVKYGRSHVMDQDRLESGILVHRGRTNG
jgi:hypothetical protein